MKQKPCGRFEGSILGRFIQSPIGVIAANWLMQGMRYMNVYELAVKLLLDLVLLIMIIGVTGWPINAVHLLYALLFAHTINWLVNGHFFTLLRYVRPVAKTRQQFDSYIAALANDVNRQAFIKGAAIYGSYSRNAWHRYSDLDVRVLVAETVDAGLKGAGYCLWLRMKAFFQAFPLDIYCCLGPACLDRLRDDEIPVVLKDSSGMLRARYGLECEAIARGNHAPI